MAKCWLLLPGDGCRLPDEKGVLRRCTERKNSCVLRLEQDAAEERAIRKAAEAEGVRLTAELAETQQQEYARTQDLGEEIVRREKLEVEVERLTEAMPVIIDALCLLNSLLECGEKHTQQSRKLLKEALELAMGHEVTYETARGAREEVK